MGGAKARAAGAFHGGKECQLNSRDNKFVGWWDKREAATAERRSRAVVTRIYDGSLMIGSVDRVGLRFECFSSAGRYMGHYYNLDQAIEAVRSAHRSARVVAGLAG